ncbi:MAG TPA: hypothetical protein VFI23_17220 [Rhizomicrobium sp.]|nr:hypothetical protein [Rhizomicrobium sp.]
MTGFRQAAVLAAAAVFAAAPALAADLTPSLESFGTARAISAYELSAPGLSGGAVQPMVAASLGSTLAVAAPSASSFASSAVLAPNLALDFGRGVDIASRLTNYDNAVSPFLSSIAAPYLSLADGGRYTGMTFVPSDNLRVRLGTAINDERLDRFRFDAGAPIGPLALTYDASQTKSLLGALSFDVSRALGLDVTAIASERSGLPLGFSRDAGIAPRASTAALSVSAHMELGQSWVTTASFSEGLTQLDPRGTFAGGTLREQSYSFSVAKRGVFGDDALGVSFSQVPPSLSGGFSMLSASGDLPLTVAQGMPLNRAPETDFQLGYVTNFLDGAVALQTNAGYQTNARGQPGATSVSLLSRAKIKF